MVVVLRVKVVVLSGRFMKYEDALLVKFLQGLA